MATINIFPPGHGAQLKKIRAEKGIRAAPLRRVVVETLREDFISIDKAVQQLSVGRFRAPLPVSAPGTSATAEETAASDR